MLPGDEATSQLFDSTTMINGHLSVPGEALTYKAGTDRKCICQGLLASKFLDSCFDWMAHFCSKGHLRLETLAYANCLSQAFINSYLLIESQNRSMDIKAIRIRNLQQIMRQRAESTAEFARTYGLDPSYLSQILNGHRGFGEKAARKMETQIGLQPGALDTSDQGNVSIYDAPPGYIPLISWVSAGRWCESPDNYAPGDAEEWMPKPRNAGPRTFALRVNNDSMTSPFPGQRSYPHGTIIYVDPDREFVSGSRVVARAGGEYTFKVYVEDAGRKYLKPINPTYDKIDVTEDVHICGVVVGSYLPE